MRDYGKEGSNGNEWIYPECLRRYRSFGRPAGQGAVMKKTNEQNVRKNTPLAVLLLILVPLYGGYYNAFVFAAGAVLACIVLLAVLRTHTLLLPAGPEAWSLYGIAACMFLSAPFAVSPGMAFTGGLRAVVWVLFFLAAAAYSPQERRAILDAVAYEGAVLAALSILDFLYGGIHGAENLNGRIDGFFQYANAWALYLLCCLLLLFLREERRTGDWIAISVLLCGIFLTGSRGTLVVLFFLAFTYGGWQVFRRRRVLPLLAMAGVFVLIGGAAALLSGGMTLRRLQAITLSSTTLNGRFLYWLDGLHMLMSHPFGAGRGGYLYLQAAEQTGIYTTLYTHNEYLQSALDGGILCGLLMTGLAAALLLRRGAEPRERAVCFAACAHAFIDFDFQFTAIVLLVLLCGSGGRTRAFRVPKRVPAAVLCGALAVLFSYFSAAYYLDLMQKPAAAYSMFPADLALAEKRLQCFPSAEDAEPLADRILQTTDLSMIAWDCKFTAAARRDDWPAMVECKYRYLTLNRYRGEVYEEFLDLLEQACLKCSPGELSKYLDAAGKVQGLLKEVTEHTSPIAYRITDEPLAFAADVQARLLKILERKE